MSDVKKLIKRLLATASNDAASDNEVEQALRSARQLMFKYHLSEDDIKFTEHERKVENTTSDFSGYGKNLSSWEASLGGYIQEFIGGIFVYYEHNHKNARRFGKAILVNGLPTEKQHLVFCGPSDLVSLAIELYSDLATMIAFMAKCKFGSVFVGEGRAYGDGFVSNLFSRLQKVDRLENNSRALVVMEEKTREVKKWVQNTQNIRFGPAKQRNLKNYNNAWNAGWSDGDLVDTNSMAKEKDRKKLG